MATTRKNKNLLPKFKKVKVITGKQIASAGGLKKWAEKNEYTHTGTNTGEEVAISDTEYLQIIKQLQDSK